MLPLQLKALKQQANQESGGESAPGVAPDGQPQIVEEDDSDIGRLTAMTNGIALQDASQAEDSDDETDSGKRSRR